MDELRLSCRKLFLRRHEVQAHIGAHDFEKGVTQRLWIDVELWVPFERPTPSLDSLHGWSTTTSCAPRWRCAAAGPCRTAGRRCATTSRSACWHTRACARCACPPANPDVYPTARPSAWKSSTSSPLHPSHEPEYRPENRPADPDPDRTALRRQPRHPRAREDPPASRSRSTPSSTRASSRCCRTTTTSTMCSTTARCARSSSTSAPPSM